MLYLPPPYTGGAEISLTPKKIFLFFFNIDIWRNFFLFFFFTFWHIVMVNRCFAVRCYVCNIGIKGYFRRFVRILYIVWYNLSFWQTKCLKTAKNRFFKIGDKVCYGGVGVWCVTEIVELGTGDGRVCVSVLFPRPWIMCVGQFQFCLRKTVSPFQCCCVYNFL